MKYLNNDLNNFKSFLNNPRKCNSASSFSGCAHRDQSKCLMALPTDAEHVSCVNTSLAFDTQILLNDKENEKVSFDLTIDGRKQTKRISTKILKMYENNQYGQAMAN